MPFSQVTTLFRMPAVPVVLVAVPVVLVAVPVVLVAVPVVLVYQQGLEL